MNMEKGMEQDKEMEEGEMEGNMISISRGRSAIRILSRSLVKAL